MSSLIYNKDLLEKLLVIAQEKPIQFSQNQLNNTAIEVIKNLRNQLSPLKASKDPTFTDIESLENFKNWAKTNSAAAQGNLLIQNDRFSLPVLEKFLVDLRDRFASNAEFSESLANLIEQANKTLGTKISIYKPAPKPAEAKPVGNNDTAKNVMVGVKVGPDGLPVEQTNQKSNPANKGLSGSAGMTLLDGMAVDFDEIYRDASAIYGRAIGMEPKIGPFLNQAVAKIGSVKARFDGLTLKTQHLNSVAAEPGMGSIALISRIEAAFNTGPKASYSEFELAEISKAFADLMQIIGTFYAGIRRIPLLAESPEIEKQIEWARLYSKNFMEASYQFTSRAESRIKIR